MTLLANYEEQDAVDEMYYYWFAQTFKSPVAFDMTSIELYQQLFDGAYNSETLKIRDCDQVTHFPIAPDLASIAIGMTNPLAWKSWNISVPNLLPNHEYAIIVVGSGDSFYTGGWCKKTVGAYADGVSLRGSGGGSWTVYAYDRDFRVNGTQIYDKVSTVRGTVDSPTQGTLKASITFAPETVTERGFDYGPDASYGSSWTETGSFGVGDYSHAFALTFPGTYHYRAKILCASGWQYGADMIITFTGQYEDILAVSDATYSQLTIFPASPTTHYDKVRVIGDSKYVKGEIGNWMYDTFGFETLMQRYNTTIKKIKLRSYNYRNNFSAEFEFRIRIGGVNYDSSHIGGTSVWTWTERLYTANPATGVAWTYNEIDVALEAGVGVFDSGIPSGYLHDYLPVRVIYVDAAVRTDGVTNYIRDTTTATLNGFVLEDEGENTCQIYFQYGPTVAYGSMTARQNKVKGEPFSANVTGIADGWHYRAVIVTRAYLIGSLQDSEFFYGEDMGIGGVGGGKNIADELIKGVFI